MKEIIAVTHELKEYIISEKFKGYDPYDILNSSLPLYKLHPKITFLLTQIHKRNPFNLRKILLIPKDIVPKGHALFLKSFVNLYKLEPNIKYEKIISELFNELCNNYSQGFSGYAWGLNYPFSNRLKYLERNSPSIVVTARVHEAIFDYYLLTNDKKAKKILFSSLDFILNDLEKSYKNDSFCFSYYTTERDICLNANAMGSENACKIILSYE